MSDRDVSATHAIATLLWIAGFTLVILAMIWTHPTLGMLGILLAGVGGVLNVRGMIHHMEGREMKALEMGVEAGEGSVTRMRRP